MRLYPGDEPPRIRRISTAGRDSNLTLSEVTFGCHIGTHVDAPAHFLAGGAAVDGLALEHFYGLAEVLFPEDTPGGTGRHLLVKGSEAGLVAECVERLVRFDPLSIGIEGYSLDPESSSEFPLHLAVARRGLPVFVCLDLTHVEPGEYVYSALPLRVAGVEGVPVRAVLLR